MSTNRVINAKDCVIRLARTDDLPLLREIFAAARAFMAEHGNATQWGANFPPDELLLPNAAFLLLSFRTREFKVVAGKLKDLLKRKS